jgi:hypothetical protein
MVQRVVFGRTKRGAVTRPGPEIIYKSFYPESGIDFYFQVFGGWR